MKPHENPSISFQMFKLDFMDFDIYQDAYDAETNDQIISDEEILERMTSSIPSNAVFLGTLSNEIDNSPGLTWLLKDDYYIIPWQSDSQFDWAVFRISWDDNRGKWEWASGAKVSGIKEGSEAAKYAISKLFENWGYDVTKEEYQVYAEFLKEL